MKDWLVVIDPHTYLLTSNPNKAQQAADIGIKIIAAARHAHQNKMADIPPSFVFMANRGIVEASNNILAFQSASLHGQKILTIDVLANEFMTDFIDRPITGYTPQNGDLIFFKSEYSANTNPVFDSFARHARTENIADTMTLIGFHTSCCVEETALVGLSRGFNVRVVGCATASISPERTQGGLNNIRKEGGQIITAAEYLAEKGYALPSLV